MPELAEVETVKNYLLKKLLNKRIKSVKVLYSGIVSDSEYDISLVSDEKINDISRFGKFIIFKLDNYYLISHLRMEGKFFIKNKNDSILKHEHVIFYFDDFTLRYHDTRKFGKMYLVKNLNILNKYGLDVFDNKLDVNYLKNKFNRNTPVKSLLLDQGIIAGIGNIYADEILYKSSLKPFVLGKSLSEDDISNIIKYSRSILTKSIECGGCTIRSYTSSLGVIGHYQDYLCVHKKEICSCGNMITKVKIGGRTSYFCDKCQRG